MNSDTAVPAPTLLEVEGKRIAIRHVGGAGATTGEAGFPPAQVLFCGGFHSTMLGQKASHLSAFCRDRGWHFTRFDYRGHGESEGNPAEFTLHDWLADTLAVLDQIKEPTLVVGSSMGGWLASLAALRRPTQVGGLLLLAAAPDFLQELIEPELGPSQIWDLQQDAVVLLDSDYEQPHPITQALLDSGRDLSLLGNGLPGQPTLQDLSCPVRLLHGTQDDVVPHELAIRLLQAIPHENASLTLLAQADHRLSSERCLHVMTDELSRLADDVAGLA